VNGVYLWRTPESPNTCEASITFLGSYRSFVDHQVYHRF